MSASLVGSEMCIRDRFPPFGGQLRCLRPTLRRLFLLGCGRRKTVCERSPCLLYTSDAADDM
eukprot:13450211-Alexandrium_andersonii.AAC.1